MGCDIHVHVELKVDGQWEHYAQLRPSRSYRTFARMAGVRGTEKPIALPRGLPDDITKMTRRDAEFWGDNGHDHSWLDCAEIRQLIDWFHEHVAHKLGEEFTPWSYLGLEDWLGCYLYGNALDNIERARAEDIRLVFWFDN